MREEVGMIPQDTVLSYDLLASGFLYGPSQLDEEAQSLWYRYLSRQDSRVRHLWRAVAGALDGKDQQELAVLDFQQCVESPIPGRYVPPYASCYLDKPITLWGPTTHKVVEWYEQGGLEWQSMPYVTSPDHVGVEWAFLAELTEVSGFKAQELRRSFIANHLSQWFPDYMDHLQKTVKSSYYPALGDFGLAVLESVVMR